jgi:GDP-4-dehydro-6-deoxy-D-mannose reductase
VTSVLVTGATGFIGRHLVPKLRSGGKQVRAVGSRSGDVADPTTWSRLPGVEVVVHLAGKSFVPDSWTHPEEFIRSNLLGTVGALGFARRHDARVVVLSSYLYGAPQRLPIPESAPTVATNPYALSKQLAEDASRFYAEQFGLGVTVLRPFNVYGSGQSEEFLIPAIIRQVKQGQAIRVKDLEPRRDYVYVADVVRAIERALECKERFSIVNVGSGVSHSVNELIAIIQDVFQTKLPVHSARERRKDEIMDTVADITTAKRVLGWVPEWTLRQGIAQMQSMTAQVSEGDGKTVSLGPDSPALK